MLELLFQFIVGHALADFVLQVEAMAVYKSRHMTHDSEHFPHWSYWLTSHSFIHGGIVYLITGSVILGIAETVIHWFIDFSKCERWINMHVDQALHILCKVIYCIIIYNFKSIL